MLQRIKDLIHEVRIFICIKRIELTSSGKKVHRLVLLLSQLVRNRSDEQIKRMESKRGLA